MDPALTAYEYFSSAIDFRFRVLKLGLLCYKVPISVDALFRSPRCAARWQCEVLRLRVGCD